MPSGQDGSGSDAYRPTSLDFINLPNPIEPSQPQAGSHQKHPLNGTPHLEKARLEQSSNRDLFKLILDPSSERPAKRQKPAENTTLDLPKLPVRNNTAKRLRIPPTLSGLHQPPPNAGLLPSISVEQPQVPPPRPSEHIEESVPRPSERTKPIPDPQPAKPDFAQAAPPQKARQRRKWSDQETGDLLKGVARFGIGSWTKILKCTDYLFDKRTAMDLKDRFRVVCPDAYKKTKPPGSNVADEPGRENESSVMAKPKSSTKGPPREQISSSKLQELGISEPFVTSDRRNRCDYTAAEDDALLRGFKKYGKAWATIRKDSELGLSERRAADLRDRFRKVYPAEYSKTGLNASASVARRAVENSVEKASGSESETTQEVSRESAPRKQETTALRPSVPKRPSHLPLFSLDDVFLGADFGGEEENGEPLILDRGILDWAGADAGRSTSNETSKSTGIDPLMTLKLPKPMSNNVLTALPSTTPSSQNNQNSLPSLASVLPDTTYPDQVELPSLMNMIGSTENDGKTGGGNFPSLEDLLS